MRSAFILLLIVAFSVQLSIAQHPVELHSTIKKVIIYKKGAQIENEATFDLVRGKNIIKLTGLSPYIDKQSVRLTGDGSYTILNIQTLKDYIHQATKNKETEAISNRIEVLQNLVEEGETQAKVIREKLDFLSTNKDIGGGNLPVDPETFKTMNVYYGEQIEHLNMELLNQGRMMKGYQKELTQLQNQLADFAKGDLPSGIIIVTLESKQEHKCSLQFSYHVDQAFWFPSYDIRYARNDMPLSVTYKANISQASGTDWKNVQIVLSTANTEISAQIPAFNPYYLQFYYPELAYAMRSQNADITGSISSVSGAPGASPIMRIRGINTVDNNDPLYVVDGIISSNVNSLNPNNIESIEILKDASTAAIYGSQGSNGVINITTRKDKDDSKPVTILEKRVTSNEYQIEGLQTILSDNQISILNFRESQINAEFEYQSLPFQSQHVYLIGKIPEWYNAEFLDGQANIYLENTFVGETNINALQYTDTMEISFGADNNISIKRERINDFSESSLMGNFRKQTVGYKITLRNNKPYAITTAVTDQVPISSTKEITVDIIEISNGNLNMESGKVQWDVKLEPGSSKEILLKYQVKFPKNKYLIVQ